MADTFLAATGQMPAAPQVTVYVHALGILCFNAEQNRAEIGFMEPDDHKLIVSIYDSNGVPVFNRDGTEVTTAENTFGSATSGPVEAFHANGSPEDLDLIFELADLYGDGIAFKPDAAFPKKLFIENAVFGTDAESHVEATPFDQANPAAILEMRNMGRVIKIATKSTDGFLRFGGETIELDPNERYEIVFRDGDCPADPPNGDFKRFYEVLEQAGPTQFNLRYGRGRFPWLSPTERRGLGRFTEHLNAFAHSSEKQADDSERRKLFGGIDALHRAFRCPPAPCNPSKIAGRSISLP